MCLSVHPSHLSHPCANPAPPVRRAISHPTHLPPKASLKALFAPTPLCCLVMFSLLVLPFSQTAFSLSPLAFCSSWLAASIATPLCCFPIPLAFSPWFAPSSLSLGSPSSPLVFISSFLLGYTIFVAASLSSVSAAGRACQHIHYTCALLRVCVFSEWDGVSLNCSQRKVCGKRRHLSGESSDGQSLGHSGSQPISPVSKTQYQYPTTSGPQAHFWSVLPPHLEICCW